MVHRIFFFWNFHCCKVVQSSSLTSTEWFVSQHCQPIINFSMVPPMDTKSSLASLHLFPFHKMGLHFWLLPTAVTQSAILSWVVLSSLIRCPTHMGITALSSLVCCPTHIYNYPFRRDFAYFHSPPQTTYLSFIFLQKRPIFFRLHRLLSFSKMFLCPCLTANSSQIVSLSKFSFLSFSLPLLVVWPNISFPAIFYSFFFQFELTSVVLFFL